MVLYRTILYKRILYRNTMMNDIVQNDTVQKDTVQNDTVQNDTVQNDTVQNDTVQNGTVQNDFQGRALCKMTQCNDIIQNDTFGSGAFPFSKTSLLLRIAIAEFHDMIDRVNSTLESKKFYHVVQHRTMSPQSQFDVASGSIYIDSVGNPIDRNVGRRRKSDYEYRVSRGQCYKTFYGRNSRIFVISLSICPRQAFPA